MGAGAVSPNTSIISFSWGIVGSVKIRSLKYSSLLNQESDVAISSLPNNRVIESRLSWVNRNFTLEDLSILDLNDSSSTDIPSIKASFQVSPTDEFKDLIDPQNFISDYCLQNSITMNESQKTTLIEKIRLECKNFWNYSRFIWMKYRAILSKKQIKHCGVDCYELDLQKTAELDKLEQYIIEKYNPDYIGLLERKLRAKMIIDRATTRPHLVFVRQSSYAEIKKNDSVVSEVNEETRLLVFCWDDVPKLSSETFLRSEIRKMNEVIKLQVKDFSQRQKYKAKSRIL